MLIDIQNITKSYPSGIVLDSVSFHIEAGQKCALIGTNGSGKTTLLKIMVSETVPDSGQIVAAAGCSIGYLPQVHEISSSMSLYEYIKDARKDVFDLEKRLRQTEALMKSAKGEELERLMKSYSSLSHEFEQKNGFAAESEIRGVLKGLGFEMPNPDGSCPNCPEEKRPVRLSAAFFFPSMTSCFLTSRQTILI